MTNPTLNVRPGDIISSALINSILDRLAEVEGQLADLELGGTPQQSDVMISGFESPGGAEVGTPMAIIGRGFIFPPLLTNGQPSNQVRLNDTPITSFLFDSSDTRLSFLVPTSLPISAPTIVSVTVSNALGQAGPAPYTLLPQTAPTVPTPSITVVAPADNPALTNTIFVGNSARITGTNFAATAAQNSVIFVVTGNPTPYTPSGPLVMVSANQILVPVPNIAEVPIIGGLPVFVRLTVAGNTTPAERVVSARRI
jgi:hypothetical protein